MPRTLTDLYRWKPKFVGQRLYIEQYRHWCIAVRSASGNGLVWLLPPSAAIYTDIEEAA